MIHIHMERNGEWRTNSKRFGKHIEPKAADLRFHSSALFIWLVVAVVWSNRLAIYRQLVGPSNQINGGKSCVCVCAVRCRTYFYCHNIACNKQDDTTHYCRCEAFRQHRYLYSIELLYYYCCPSPRHLPTNCIFEADTHTHTFTITLNEPKTIEQQQLKQKQRQRMAFYSNGPNPI